MQHREEGIQCYEQKWAAQLSGFSTNAHLKTHASGPAAAFSGAVTVSSTPEERKTKQVSAQLGASTEGGTGKSDQLIKEKDGAFQVLRSVCASVEVDTGHVLPAASVFSLRSSTKTELEETSSLTMRGSQGSF